MLHLHYSHSSRSPPKNQQGMFILKVALLILLLIRNALADLHQVNQPYLQLSISVRLVAFFTLSASSICLYNVTATDILK